MGETLTEETAEAFRLLLHWESLTADTIKKMANKSILNTNDSNACRVSSAMDSPEKRDANLFAEFDIVPDKNEVDVHYFVTKDKTLKNAVVRHEYYSGYYGEIKMNVK